MSIAAVYHAQIPLLVSASRGERCVIRKGIPVENASNDLGVEIKRILGVWKFDLRMRWAEQEWRQQDRPTAFPIYPRQ